MIVWVLVVLFISHRQPGFYDASRSAVIIDNIESEQSCKQLAIVIRQNPDAIVTCAPVRKVRP